MQTTLQTFKYGRKNFRRPESRVTEDGNISAVKNLHKYFIIFNVNAAWKALIPFLSSGMARLYTANIFKIFNSFTFNSLELLEIILFYYMKRTSNFLPQSRCSQFLNTLCFQMLPLNITCQVITW